MLIIIIIIHFPGEPVTDAELKMDSSQETGPSAEQGAQNDPDEGRTDPTENAGTLPQNISQASSVETAGPLQPETPNTGTELENQVRAEATSQRTGETPHDRQDHSPLTGDNPPETAAPQEPSQSSQTEDGFVVVSVPPVEGSDYALYGPHYYNSATEYDDENVICVKFYAALQKGLGTGHDEMYLVCNGLKFRMTPVRTDGAGRMFTLSLSLYKADAEVHYTYCLTDKKDKFETLEDEKQKYTYRTLYRNISQKDKVFHQFDDVCMQPETWWPSWGSKTTKINTIREEFIQSTLTQLMNCTNADLSEMQATVNFFCECLQTRRVSVPGLMPVKLQISWDNLKGRVDRAFKCAIEESRDTTPVQYVLAAALLAMFLHVNLEKATIEKLSKIIERNGELQGPLASLEDSVRRKLSEAVRYMFNLACDKSPNAALWFMALFYALSPESVKLLPDRQQAMPQVSYRNLSEVIKTHSLVINRHEAFRAAVLNMANLEHLQLLSKLNITPDELLSQLKKWQTCSSFHKLHQAVEVVALRIKAWLNESQEESTSETLKTDVRSCLQKTLNILETSLKDRNWIEHWDNVLSALQLLNAFTDSFDHLSDDMNPGDYRPSFSHLSEKMSVCISYQKDKKALSLERWSQVFNLPLPNIWQKDWEEILKTHFKEYLKKKKITDQVKYYCNHSGVCPAMDNCMLVCAQDAINRLTSKSNQKGQQFSLKDLLRSTSESPKCGTLVSFIIESKLRALAWNREDYLYLLYDEQLRDVFLTMQQQQMDKIFTAHLPTTQLIQRARNLMDQLIEEMKNKSIPCKLLKGIIESKHCANSYLLGKNMDAFQKTIKEAEEDFKKFESRKSKVKVLNDLNQGMPVDVKHLETTLSIELDKEERSLKTVMDMVISEEPGSDTHFLNNQAFEKIHLLSKSTYFKELWRKTAKQAKDTEFKEIALIPLDQVYDNIYKPAFEEFRSSYEALKDLSMSLLDLESKLGKFLNSMSKELKTMADVFTEDKQEWIQKTREHIERYRALQSAKENAEVIIELKNNLGLCGDFGGIDNLEHMDCKCLCDLTENVSKVGNQLREIPKPTVSFLREFNECIRRGFISWIKEIIKDTGELTAFVELASISAGENSMDIGKVCCFRDAISAAAPIIYQLSEISGIKALLQAVNKLGCAIESDKNLETKLKDSCDNMEWLKIAYETHGSVERSSLHQATDINESGLYIIKSPSEAQARINLENCITLRCKEILVNGQDAEYRTYSLSELQELQNKLMLITVSVKNREDEITTYIEVLEQIINVGKCFLELRDAGHILFQDWEMTAYCQQKHDIKIWVKFGITNVEIKGYRPLLDELKGLCESMRGCLSEWLKYTEQKRNMYYYLNYFTAKQLVYLCCSVAEFRHEWKNISTGLLNMLSIMKDNIKESDVQNALTKALETPAESGESQATLELKKFLNVFPDTIEYFLDTGITEEEIKAAIMFCEEDEQVAGGYRDSRTIEEYQDTVMQCIDDHQNDEEWVQEWCEKYETRRDSVLKNQMKFKGGLTTEEVSFSMTEEQIAAAFENLENSDEKIVMLWKTYHNKLSGLVSDKFVDLDVLGETMNHLAKSAEVTVKRKLPIILEGGKPNLISCKDVEMLPLCLSLYKDKAQPLPTYDEILVCTSETTAEEVELIIRRAVQPGSTHEKIYCLLNADKLNHDVSRKFESIFYKKTQEAHVQGGTNKSDYQLIIFCDSKAHHSYVATAFDMFKRTVSESPNLNDEIKQYLQHKHQTSSEVETGFSKLNQLDQFQLKTKLIFSEHAGMGKSLYVKNLVKVSEQNLKSAGFTYKTIRISQSQLRTEDIASQLRQYEDKPMDKVPRIFHFDIPPVVTKGLYTFLLQLFVLRCFQSPDGIIWRYNDSHIYLVEYTKRKHRECDRDSSEISSQVEDAFLEMLPTVKCLSPEETLRHLEQKGSYDKDYRLMDEGEFRSEAFQRTYQYFKIYRLKQDQLEAFSFDPEFVEDSPKEWLECLLQFCDIKNPSWGELRNFTHFLNSQLKKCEQSIFCSAALKDDLTGFKKFVVKFMMTMSKDFSMRSLKTSDDSDEKVEDAAAEDTALKEFQLRRRWEQQAHPYILFNADNDSMTFLGFHIHNLDAVDARTKEVVEKKIIDKTLFIQLKAQRVPFNIDFENMPRAEQLVIIGRVLGVGIVKDPDDTYQLTLDNVMKILAIHLRFESDIPVIIMGETGCGKTRLVQFMCDLLRSGKERQNLIVVRVHGGTSSEVIYKKVRKAIEISKENEVHNLDTVLFFDEANTTEAVNAIKEVICDKSVNGEQIEAPRLKIIAACNPYRKHSKEAIEQLERAGLGYRVRSENTEEKLGQIPMRQLVYRVQPLPPSLTPLVWDFGKLNEHTQELYITQMVKTFFRKENLPDNGHQALFTKVISASQKHMVELTDECRMVSLRDIERCMKTVMWFYQQRRKLFQEIDRIRGEKGSTDDLVRSLILAIGVCYLASLENRNEYLEKVAKAFSPGVTDIDIQREIELCKEAFISNVNCPASVAKNKALKENVFMMVVCMNLRIPLFLVGKPGSSKSLSKTIAAHAMQGKASPNALFKGYKQAQLASFQCSPHSSPDGIISIFRQCAQFQKDKNLEEYVAVVVLDEIGLAEDSPKMPLKTLHPLLEYGCVDDESPDQFKKVGFIGISNWSLDPAKMNRGILVLRTSPVTEELENTARDICSSDKEPVDAEIKCLIPKLTEFYLRVLEEQKSEFFGLRDFYSLVKLIMSYAIEANGRPSDEDLTKAVQRNFDGLDSLNVLEIFYDIYKERTRKCDIVSLLRENLDIGTSGFTSRYLLLPTINHAALQILKSQNIIDESNVEIIFGSGFPHDEEYSQVCRTVNRVKTCMETGRSVVLLNIQSLYESLYDALNQCYVKLGGSYYVDLGLGSHRVKCRVKDEFRLIVIEEKSTVYEQFPTPLLNRLEKHCLEISNILPNHAQQMQAELEEWLNSFVTQDSTESNQLISTKKTYDTIVGYTEDTCASVLLQCCPQIVSRELDHDEREEVLEMAQEMLLQCATPDSVLRATTYMEENSEKFLEAYFVKQPHGNLIEALKKYREAKTDGICLEVSTYSRLLNKRDVEKINKELDITESNSCLFLLNEFYTEQAFSQTVSEFLGNDAGARKLVLLQSYFDDPKQSQRLLFCVRHSITRIKSSVSGGAAFDVVLLTRLPRISGGCGYIATFGDGWVSLHIDELIATPGFPGDIYELQRMTVSESLAKSSFPATEDPDMDSPKTPFSEKQDVFIDTHLLMKKSLQKGILKLRDKADNTQRATKRVEILHGLLQNKYAVSAAFIKSLERRIISFLSEQEKMKGKESWVVAQALSDRIVAEGSSFRHVLWVHLEGSVASALAHILAVIDGDNNLDNLINDQPSEKSDFWLNVFQEDQWDLLHIPGNIYQGQVSVLSTTGDQTKSWTCHFPFSWALKDKFEQIWACVINLKGPSVRPTKEYLEKFEELIPLTWIKSITKGHELFAMFSEDLVNISMPSYPHELNKSFSETLTRLAPRLYRDLTGNDPDCVPLPWLYVVNKYMQDNHQLFYSLYFQNKDVVTGGEATEALRQVLQGLQPKESELKDFDSCQEWLKKVKSLSVTVDLILSEDSLVTRHAENAEMLISKIRLLWQSTWIIYLLMDHLLQNEQEMEKKLLTFLVRNLLFAWKKLNSEEGKEMECVIDHVTGTLAKCSKNACNVFKVVCGYCDKDFTEDDTAEVECGHMFHISCLKEHSDTQCRKCKKQINQDYKPCGVVAKETFLKVNRFRRKCNSFFVEFMWNFVSSKEQLTDNVLNKLMDYVRCSPSAEATSERSTLQQYMNPDLAVQSLILKILLKCGMEETAPQLQRFVEEAVKSNERNADEIYFMVVRSIEDHIYFSSQGCLISKAIKCLGTCVLHESEQNMISEHLHTIAKLRFAITVASDAIRSVLSEEVTVDAEECRHLLRSLQELLSNTGNPWVQIFLLRNICETHGFSLVHQLGQSEKFQWTIPSQVLKEQQDMSTRAVDQFQMYGQMYEKITVDSFKALEEPSHEIAQEFDESIPCFRVCMALAAVRQATQNTASTSNAGSLISKMRMKSSTDTSWGQLVKICESELEDCTLSQIVLHTALVAQVSTAPEMKLLHCLCFSPGECKDFFIPTMPNSVNEIKEWIKNWAEDAKKSEVPSDNLKIWVCRCGEPVLIGNCGRPWVKSQCASCGSEVGGERHNAVEGFTEFNHVQGSGRGHNLGDPNSRKEQDGERSLYGANLHMVRALIHSSMIWGTIEHTEEVQNLTEMPQGAQDVRKLLFGHLQKDIELLAKALGKSEQDAEMTVHLFLKFILESSSEPNIQLQITDSEEKREEWEKVIHQRLQLFFQTFEAQLLDVQSNILRLGGMDTLAQIIYRKEPTLKDLPTSGVFNLPLMWSFEQKMTIQRFSHLIEQKDERRNVPLLSELLKSHVHIRHIRYLPQVLSLQQKLMCYFENLDLQCYNNVPINTFRKETVADHDQQAFSESAEIVKLLWKHLKSINYSQLTAELKEKDENNLMILDLLPTERSVARIITKYLSQMQNNFIQMSNPTADRVITANELKPSHVITCVPEQDFLTIAISNIDHVVHEDGKKSTNYNFKTVERQIIDRFFKEKPMIKVTTLPLFEYDTGTTLRCFFSTVQDKLEPLSTNDRNCIMNDFRFLNEISAALSTLRIVIGFLKLSFPAPEQKLMAYLKKDLKLDDRAQTLNLQVLRSSQVKHIQSLWEALSLRQSSLLIEMNQNPFIMIEDRRFHETFTKDQKNENKTILANIPNLDVLITELHYVILNIKLKDVRPDWKITETFDAFLDCDEIHEKAIHCLKDLQEMEMRYGIALWKLAVQIKKGIKTTESV
ncbi:E3 ubiquitin-protein ligase rnf213-alpha isoform X2 [Pangasianodon hypophthalmus]|uniref:E3 ubiquitin-protein ligase rnf213-alpha isoform X2 n=1 Tax=Pangasianodon hypophthalmus TaxID=310915 RepID=UPI0023071CDA|nr:E3 ubiquitin-protein ligase rnf213-alpha isoform X2 [Pangasianodon hypophthalmus]